MGHSDQAATRNPADRGGRVTAVKWWRVDADTLRNDTYTKSGEWIGKRYRITRDDDGCWWLSVRENSLDAAKAMADKHLALPETVGQIELEKLDPPF